MMQRIVWGSRAMVEGVFLRKLTIKTSYSDYQRLLPIFSTYDFLAEDTQYLEEICVNGSVIASKFSEFENKIIEATSGRSTVDQNDTVFDYRS